MNKLEYNKYTLEENKNTLKKYVHELINISDVIYHELLKEKEKVKSLKKDIQIFQAKLIKLREEVQRWIRIKK